MSKGFGGIYVTPMHDRKKKTMSKDIEIRGGGRSIGKSYEAEIARANRYKEYMSNNAYIPLQDLSRYQKAYNNIYGGKKSCQD